MRVLWSRIRELFIRHRLDARLDEEVQAHLEELAAEYMRRGATPEQARRAAQRAFGAVEPMKERYRDRRGLPWLDDLRQDLRYAARGLVHTPVLAAVAVITLAVGIGANTAIFSLLEAVLLRPLPVQDPGNLVLASYQVEGRQNLPFATYQFRALRAQREVLSDLSAFRPLPVSVSYRGDTDMAMGQLVSGNYYGLLGVSAALGRVITEADDAQPGSHPVAVISEGFWQRRFGGSANVLGQSIRVNGRPFTIIGVSARGFTGTEAGRAFDVTIPLSMQMEVFGQRSLISDASQARWLYLIGRLAPGVSRDRAKAALVVTLNRLRSNRTPSDRVVPTPAFVLVDGSQGVNGLRERFSIPLRVLMALVVLLLVIACGNLATLLIARSSARRQEIGLRLALGASGGRVLRQLLAESLLLSTIAGAIGIGLAFVVNGVVVELMSGREGAVVLDLTPNVRTLAFTFGVSVCAGLVFGIVPSLRAARFAIATAARPIGTTHAGSRWSQATTAAQVALTVLLLVEAGLFARSLSSLRGLDTGYTDGRSVLLANIRPAGTADGLTGVLDLFRHWSTQLPALGATAVTFTMDTPLGGVSMTSNLESIDGVPQSADGEPVSFNFVGPDFFRTLGIPLQGRDIRVEDDERAQAVAVISRSVARRYFPGVNPVGKRIRSGGADVEIVGVAADVKYLGVQAPPTPMVYLPYLQGRDASGVAVLTLAVRSAGRMDDTIAAVRRETRAFSPQSAMARLTTLDELMNETLARERIVAWLSMAFGAIALLLGCIGVYGTMAYAVGRRTRELGVRIALGALGPRLTGMVLGESLRPVAIGMAFGLPIALAAGRLSESLLFGVSGRDPATYVIATSILVLSAMAAAWLPARRASSVDPIVALRSE
jgi:predicted permease